MSVDKVINMVINRVLRILINKGVDGAMSVATGKKKRRPQHD